MITAIVCIICLIILYQIVNAFQKEIEKLKQDKQNLIVECDSLRNLVDHNKKIGNFHEEKSKDKTLIINGYKELIYDFTQSKPKTEKVKDPLSKNEFDNTQEANLSSWVKMHTEYTKKV